MAHAPQSPSPESTPRTKTTPTVPTTADVSRRAVLGGLGAVTAFAVLPGRPAWAEEAATAVPPPSTTLSLSNTWKFAIDPDRVGESQEWHADTFDDGGWQSLLSGRSWESQGINYAGYAWYRQQFTVPATAQGTPLTLVLASIASDDDVWFNGVRIGGLKGQYKYNNRLLRTYAVAPSVIRYGLSNTIAVRVWGGDLETVRNSGLVAGRYQAVFNPYRLMARAPGGSIGTETPIELRDLSAAQRGAPFELVIRIDPVMLTGTHLTYTVTDFYGAPITSGQTPTTVGSDGIPRGVVSLDAAATQRIYLAGRFKVHVEMTTASGVSDWVDTGTEMTVNEPTVTDHFRIYRKTFEAGTVVLPPDGDGTTPHSMYMVAVTSATTGLTLSNLTVRDTANANDWSAQSNLRIGNQAFGDRTFTVASLPTALVGAAWIRVAQDSKSSTADPLATFSINQQATVYVAVESRAGRLPWTRTLVADNLNFSNRDTQVLPAMPAVFEDTPYGSLKLVDTINCGTSLDTEVHPYLQSSYEVAAQQRNTPGSSVDVTVTTILGKPARESGYGWFAYRIGRGKLTVGGTYLIRIEYPEDKPRYSPIEIQAGQNYMDVGWRNGLGSTDVYDPWPLSGAWQFFDVIVPVGKETLSAGGTGDGDGQNGIWVYFQNKIKPGFQFTNYAGGPAVATIKLYEISSSANAPKITRPAGLPSRVLSADWERQPTHVPSDVVKYAKLMGYSAISPLTLKWAFANYADPVTGYDSINVDLAHYWVTGRYVQGSGQPPPPAVPGVSSVHNQYLQATKGSGIDYIPRFEYGGSYDLPLDAQATGSNGLPANPNRFGVAGHLVANLLDPRTYADLKVFLDSLLKPYAATNPQLKGALWRIRSDRMQPSYRPTDIDLFSSETGTPKPAGLTPAQLAAWAATGDVGVAYSTWWQGKRAAFHQRVLDLLKTYRSDLALYYYNWDPDKFSMIRPDLNQAAFYVVLNARGGQAAYAADRAARATYTAADYVTTMRTGDFSGWLNTSRPDYAMRPYLYDDMPGFRPIAPANHLCYADKPEYLNYFRTQDGLAVSNAVSYDEAGARYSNPKFEGSMMLPGGGPFSLAVELLAYYHGDARSLNYTVYTYGRGYADAHRRFAQAYLALPAVPGNVVDGTPANVRARVYATLNGTYIGIAHKGHAATPITVDVPGPWTAQTVVTNLVTGQFVPAAVIGGKLRLSLQSGPMELNAFLASAATSTFSIAATTPEATVTPGQAATYTLQTAAIFGSPRPIQLSAAGAPPGSTVTFSQSAASNGQGTYRTRATHVRVDSEATMTIATSASTPVGTYYLTVTGTSDGLSDSARVVALTIKPALTITDMWVADTANSADWQLQPRLRTQIAAYSDRNYIFTRAPSSLLGAQWIRTAVDSKSVTATPLITFTINQQATVSVAVDTRLGKLPWMDSSWVQPAGARFTFDDDTGTEISLTLYQKTFPAGPVSLGPNAGGTFSATYTIVVK